MGLQEKENTFNILFYLKVLSVILALVVLSRYLGVGSKEDSGGKALSGVRPDIILISIDSLRPDHLKCYGYGRETSPNIDKLAREGVLFKNAVSTTSWTLPAHAAMFTGLYDSAHGVMDAGHKLSDRHITLPRLLLEAGYQTAGFFGGPFLHPVFGFGQGFMAYESCMTTLADGAKEDAIRHESIREDSVSHKDITGPLTLEKFKSWIKKADRRPMFVFLHLWDVHYDYIPPKKYVEMFDPGYTGDIRGDDFLNNSKINSEMAPRDLEHVIALYDGEIRFTDDILGEILAELDRYGRLDNALVVLTADHGEEFFEHGRKGHNQSLYDEVILVPLIFRWPGQLPKGLEVNDQVRLIDLAPTIMDLAGVPFETKIQGRSISSLLRGGTLGVENALSELFLEENQFRTLRNNRMKLMENRFERTVGWFDLNSDPGELNLFSELTLGSQQMFSELKSVIDASLSLRSERMKNTANKVKISGEVKKRLQSLGYIGGE